MPTSDTALRLCRHGALLFVLGLVNGALVPMLTNSCMVYLVAVLLYAGSAGILVGGGACLLGTPIERA